MKDKNIEKIFKLLEKMWRKGILKDYAIGGATATIYYTEPFATRDIDIFFVPTEKENLILLTPIYDFLLNKGYKVYKEYIMIGDIPLQFIPISNELEKEAVSRANSVKYKNIEIRILKPEYLIAIFLKVFRPKDREKLIKLLEQAKLNNDLLSDILKRHRLNKKFSNFRKKYYEK